MKLSDKVAIVTGAGSGIGRAVAETLAKERCRVSIADVAEAAARQTAERIGELARSIVTVGDVSVAADARRMVQETVAAFGRLDILCNIAGGMFGSKGSVVEVEEDAFDRVMAVNVKGTFVMSKYAVPAIVAAGGGAIVNCASIAGLVGRHRSFAYATAKAAVIHLTRCMAIDHGPEGVRVNCICPGMTATPILATSPTYSSPAAQAEYADQTPLRRMAEPEEIARAVLFLVSDEASFVTGTCLPVDGGRSA